MGKAEKTITGKTLDNNDELPATLFNQELNLKIMVDWDLDISKYAVSINGDPFESLPFLDPSFSKSIFVSGLCLQL